MNPIHLNSSSEELAKRLDAALSSDDALSPSSEKFDDPRVYLAVRIATMRHPEMSPEMTARVRSKMIAVHRRKLQRQRVWQARNTFVLRWAAVLAVVVICLNAAVFPSLASSVPGEFLYPFKRSLENVELSIAPSLSAKAQVYLIQAQRRIDEAHTLLQRQRFDSRLIIDVRSSLALFEQLAPQLPNGTAETAESQAASVNESVAILLQDAEQSQVLSGNQVTALLPTFMPSLESVEAQVSASSTVTATPPPQPTALIEPTSLPTDIPTVDHSEVVEPLVTLTEEPTLTPVDTDTPLPSDTPAPTATLAGGPVVTMYALANANVRSQPGTDQTIITVLPFGEVTQVIGEDNAGKWWHVRLHDGQLGWIAKFLLSVHKPTPTSVNNGNPGENNGSSDGNNGNSGDNSGNNDNDGFGCDHSGNYCNAPGQTSTSPSNSGNGNPPSNSGNGNSGGDNGNGHK